MIIFVVIGHFADFVIGKLNFCKSIFIFIYAFHMPVLLFVSGLFYKRENHIQKAICYVCCGFAIKIYLSIVQYAINLNTSFVLLSDGNTPWFFFVLAVYQILLYILKKTDLRFLLVFSVILACFVGYDQTIGDYLYLSRAIVFLPYFILGTLLRKDDFTSFVTKHKNVLILSAIAIVALWIYVCVSKVEAVYGFFRGLFVGRNPFYPSVVPYGPLARLLCYLVSFLTGFSIIILIPQKKIPLLTSLGAHTENVYFWHYGLYQLIAKYIGIEALLSESMGIMGVMCFFGFAIILATVLSLRPFNFPLSTIRKYVLYANSNKE